MPSAGMRPTTRSFGVAKKVDGARVLRSGRRLVASREAQPRRSNESDVYYHLMNDSHKDEVRGAAAIHCKANGFGHKDDPVKEPKKMKVETPNGESVDRMFGRVYTRKRKRTEVEKCDSSWSSGDKKYGIRFSRRQRRKIKSEHVAGLEVACGFEASHVLSLVASDQGFWGRRWWFSSFLSVILGYMKREKLRLPDLAAFLLSEPISGVYFSNGVNLLWGPPAHSTGICKFFGAERFIPLFSVDFYAVPHCFMYMHCSMLLRWKCLRIVPVDKPDTDDEVMSDSEEEQPLNPNLKDVLVRENKYMAAEIDNPGNKVTLHPSVRASKLASRNSQCRNGLGSLGIQKRRSSLRRRRARNPSVVGVHKPNGALVSDLISSRRNGIPFSSVVSKNKLRSSVRSSSAANLRDLSSTMVDLAQDVDLSHCFANILVIQMDRCYREEGAVVTLEFSASSEWLLVVKKDGMTKYTHKAQKDMKPCASNRITHAIIWTGDDNWKLEFPHRQDWFIFKELYKECSDRNVPAPIVKVIPVPGVHEVPGYKDIETGSFCRPDSYISVNSDEVSRALAKRSANYDMDSEDEEWLMKFNNEFLAGNEFPEHLSEDMFELMIDAFEKAYYCSPDDFSSEKAAANLCLDLGRKEVVEAVYSYWLKKRKQKRSALLKVFQAHHVKKAPFISKSWLRKTRSFKRQTSHGRGKHPSVLQAMAAEQDALEEQNALRKVEEAKASANRSIESAVQKRRRAQLLMENANMATYKAMMAVRIAEAARVTESLDAAVDATLFD